MYRLSTTVWMFVNHSHHRSLTIACIHQFSVSYSGRSPHNLPICYVFSPPSTLSFRSVASHSLPSSSALPVSRRSAPRYFLVCGLAQVKCLSQGSPLKHDGRRKTTKRKKRAKGFQGFLYGTSGGRNSKGSSPGPPGRKK